MKMAEVHLHLETNWVVMLDRHFNSDNISLGFV
jgi:hypothetical protein